MKRMLMAAMAVALVMGSVTVASAQRGQGGGGGRFGQGGPFGQGGGLQILRIPAVQIELKMSEAQIAKLDAKQDEVRNATRELRESAGNIREMSEEDRAKFMAKNAEIQNKAIAEVLEPGQMKRYKELVLQREGPLAAARKEVADALKLTEDQRKQITAIQAGVREESMQLFQSLGQGASPEDRQKAMGKMPEIQAKAGEKVLALFTADQKKAWTEMTGAPFKFPAPGRPAA